MDNSLTSYKIFVIAAFLFFTGSVLGWFIELFYRKFFERVQNPQRRWVNPGFLTGPWLPVYGFGALSLFAMSFVETFISGLDKGGAAHYVLMIVFMALIMTGIEFAAGIIFIKGMKIRLWDYSDEWGNLWGIICPKYALFWAALSAAYYFLLFPPFLDLVMWFIEHPWFSFVVGTLFGIFVVDCAFSLKLGTALRKKAMQIDKASAINIQKMQSALRQDRMAKFFSAHSERFLTEKLQSFEDFISRSPAKMSASREDKR